jgi:hypothetical protein
MRQVIHENLLQLIADPNVYVEDNGDYVVFSSQTTSRTAIIQLKLNQCDYYEKGERIAVFVFSKAMKYVALRRLIEVAM